MAVQDHVAIILSCSLDRPAPNKKKPHAAPRFYVRAAFPPTADNDLGEAMAKVAPGGNWQAVSHNIKPNGRIAKPYPGVPDDYLIVKFDTQYPVPVYGEDTAEIPVNADNSARIRSQFYAGQRARIEGAPYTWINDGEQGISWNLYGALAVGGGERRAGSGGDGFSKYRQELAPVQSGGFGTNSPQQTNDTAQSGGFGQPAPQAAPAAQTNEHPFVQQNGAAAFSADKPFG